MTGFLTRRRLLGATGAAALAAPVASCDLLSTDPEGSERDTGAGGKGTGGGSGDREAPALAARVRDGELPRRSRRLPHKPLIVDTREKSGSYGEQWRNALIGAGDAFRLNYTIGYENLVSWDIKWKKVVPNVAESVEIGDGGRRYTFGLRPGLRWSDGKPFTAEDIAFAYNDMLSNQKLMPVLPSLYSSDGETAKLETPDPHTARFTFSTPNGLFLEQIASNPTNLLTCLPRHYLERFHPKYGNPDDAAAKKHGYDGARNLLEAMVAPDGGLWHDPDLPRLHAWLPTSGLGTGSRIRFERNPYYWKTDKDGRQLPYLDGVTFDMVGDDQVLLLKVVHGEIDMIGRHVNTPKNKPVLARNRESAGYGFFDLKSDKVNTLSIMLNLTCKDPVLREIFGNREFRVGLSHAINRPEIIKTVHKRQGTPWQVAPQKGTPFYDEEFATQFTAYDVDRANAHLDRAGYAERDGNGKRLGPDGNPIAFGIDVAIGAGKPYMIDSLELIRGYWRAVGIDLTLKQEDLTLYVDRRDSNQAQACVWDGDGGIDAVMTPGMYVPTGPSMGYAPAWGLWYQTSGKSGEEPPAPTRRQMELYDRLRTEVKETARDHLMHRILTIAKEQFYTIGVSSPVPMYGIVKDTFTNMVDRTYFAAHFPVPGATRPEQYFIDGRAASQP